jgi:hypothetical protein
MTNSRLFAPASAIGSMRAMALYEDERQFEGDWSHPNVPLLIFKDSTFGAGQSVSPHGGPVGSGLPVQLVFWGSWWNSPAGADRLAMIEDRVERTIASPYFSQLAQYGVAPPTFRGSIVVTQPAPPMNFATNDDEKAVPNLIDDLIDDDVFPDPDDEKIAFVVLMPQGFTETVGSNGAHTWDYDYEFPFDKDWYWVAWVRYFDPGVEPGDDEPENTNRTLSHELVELFTDPEGDQWYNAAVKDGEIADAAWSNGTRQTAWVNGARVSAYWSNAHTATVIPIDRDYRARIVGDIEVEGRHELDRGTFRPEPNDRILCGHVDVCCIEDRDYTWFVSGRDEVATLRAETHRYRSPVASWTIGGTPVKGSGSLGVPLQVWRYRGRTLESANASVTVGYDATDTTLTLTTTNTGVNFDLDVACSIHDASITGTLTTDVVAAPATTVGFVGAELVLDADYERQRAACQAWIAAKFEEIKHKARFHRPKPGEPVEIDPGILVELPAWTRVRRFAQVRKAVLLADIGRRVLPTEVADAFTASLIADAPELASVINGKVGEHRPARD